MIRTFLLSSAALVAAAAAQAQTLAIVHAKAETMAADGPVEDATIVIVDGRIQSVAARGAVPPGMAVIDAGGRPVTPGLMASATQLGLIEVSSGDDTMDDSVDKGELGAAFDVTRALNSLSLLLPIARADGLTRSAVAPTGSAHPPFAGTGAVIRLREEGGILDRAKVAMFIRVGGGSADSVGGSRAAQWTLIRNALDEAKHYRINRAAYRLAAGRDQITNRLDIEALQPVIAGTMPLVIQASRESDVREAVALAQDYAVKVIVRGGHEAWRVAPLLAQHRIPVILDPSENIGWSFDTIGVRRDSAAILQRAGVLIAFAVSGVNSTHNAGSTLRAVAGLAVANGLDHGDALRALTANPARIWGVADRYGTLRPGADGDVVIWSGDPLEPSTTPTAVIVAGKPADLANRQTLLRDRYRGAASRPLPPAYSK